MSDERQQARDNANRWLEQASMIGGPDPDGPEVVLARQYMRALDKIGRLTSLVEQMPHGDLSNAMLGELEDRWPAAIQ